tara:strand:- start:1019 stop:1282 length:264 start_codon:yes stop_codon:yes gene_type:complete
MECRRRILITSQFSKIQLIQLHLKNFAVLQTLLAKQVTVKILRQMNREILWKKGRLQERFRKLFGNHIPFVFRNFSGYIEMKTIGNF